MKSDQARPIGVDPGEDWYSTLENRMVNAGYVEIDTTMTTQAGRSVFEGDMKFLFKRREADQ